MSDYFNIMHYMEQREGDNLIYRVFMMTTFNVNRFINIWI